MTRRVENITEYEDMVAITVRGGQVHLDAVTVYLNRAPCQAFLTTQGDGYRFYATYPHGTTKGLPVVTSTQVLYGLRCDPTPSVVVAVDIETSGLGKSAEIELVGLHVRQTEPNDEYAVVLWGDDAEPLLYALLDLIAPTLIIGHNIYGFDLPLLEHHWMGQHKEQAFPFRKMKEKFRLGTEERDITHYVFVGRNWVADTVDTYLLSERADQLTGGDIPSFSLRSLVAHLFGDEQRGNYLQTEDKVGHLLKDLKDTHRVFEFFDFIRGVIELTPITWRNYLINTGSLIGLFFVVLFAPFMAVPMNQLRKEFRGALVELRQSGYFENIVSADVVSLYPNIILRHIVPVWDEHDWFRGVVRYILQKRLEAKAKAKALPAPENRRWHVKQMALKILVNSFYGYLASGGNYSDADCAAKIAEIGRETVAKMCQIVERYGGKVIEVDTDGVYFTAAPEETAHVVAGLKQEMDYEIEANHYDAGLFVKKKNYVLLKGKEVIYSGGSLRNRRDNAVYKQIIADIFDFYRFGTPTLNEIWERCLNEYSRFRLSSVPKLWRSGEDKGAELVATLDERLDNIDKLYNVIGRFSSLPEVSEFLKTVGNRVRWRRWLQNEGQLQLSDL